MNSRAASRAVSKPRPGFPSPFQGSGQAPGEAGDRNPQEPRSKPRFLLLHHMKKAGQAPHFVIDHVPKLPGNMFTPWGQAAGYSSSRESGINAGLDTLNRFVLL